MKMQLMRDIIQGESKKVYTFKGLLNKKYAAKKFETKILIYQSKANLDVKFCLAISLML